MHRNADTRAFVLRLRHGVQADLALLLNIFHVLNILEDVQANGFDIVWQMIRW